MSGTIFCDIDGVLVYQGNDIPYPTEAKILPGVLEKFYEWSHEGYVIILTTARKESGRKLTEKQLGEMGLYYDQLIMGLPFGPRFVINDTTDLDKPKAIAINLLRNDGLKGISIKKI